MTNPPVTGEAVERLIEQTFPIDEFRFTRARAMSLCRAAIAALTNSPPSVSEELEPFASFAEHSVDENGWVGRSGNERISDWFGPSDFRKAALAMSAKDNGQ